VQIQLVYSEAFNHTASIMNSITNLTPGQLRQAANIQEKIQALQKELGRILGTTAETTPAKTRKRQKISGAGLANIRAAQKARWAAKRAQVQGMSTAAKPAEAPKKKAVSEAKLRALAKAREARWAKARAGKKAQSNEQPKKKRKMTAAWRQALERAWAARRAKTKAAEKAKV